MDVTEEGRLNDIIADMWVPSTLLDTGNWTFEFIAKVPVPEKEICLFALSFTQWLEGKHERIQPSGSSTQKEDKEKVQ